MISKNTVWLIGALCDPGYSPDGVIKTHVRGHELKPYLQVFCLTVRFEFVVTKGEELVVKPVVLCERAIWIKGSLLLQVISVESKIEDRKEAEQKNENNNCHPLEPPDRIPSRDVIREAVSPIFERLFSMLKAHVTSPHAWQYLGKAGVLKLESL